MFKWFFTKPDFDVEVVVSLSDFTAGYVGVLQTLKQAFRTLSGSGMTVLHCLRGPNTQMI